MAYERTLDDPCICSNVRKTSSLLTQFYDRPLAPTALRVTQFGVLSTIRSLGTANLAQLGVELTLDQTSHTRSFQLLQQQKLIKRVRSEDARERRYALTAVGLHRLELAKPRWEKVQAQIMARLGKDGFEQLQHNLNLVEQCVIEASAEEPGG